MRGMPSFVDMMYVELRWKMVTSWRERRELQHPRLEDMDVCTYQRRGPHSQTQYHELRGKSEP